MVQRADTDDLSLASMEKRMTPIEVDLRRAFGPLKEFSKRALGSEFVGKRTPNFGNLQRIMKKRLLGREFLGK